MSRLRLPAVIFIALLVAACFFGGCSFWSSNGSSDRKAGSAAVKPAEARKNAPDFALKDADGRPVRLSDYRGKVVLLDFWATWCGPCKMEIPWFIDLQRRQKDKGFVVLGVSMDDEGWEVVRPFISRLGVNYRVLLGDDATAQMYGGVDALPTTFLIDREGRIAAVHVGLGSRKDFEDGVEQLLQAPAQVSHGRARVALPTVFAGAK